MDNTQSRRWPFFLIGVLLFLLGPALYAGQFFLAYLDRIPWYFPALSTLGVLFMIASVWQRRGIVRPVALCVFALFCGTQWLFFVVLTRTPEYQGPAQVGSKVAPFTATLADGRSFSNQDLESGNPTVLLFYRGHW